MAVTLELEGFDYAASVLRRYDASRDEWDLPRDGDLWDAVGLARAVGRRGAGKNVGIVEAGFDTTVPALAGARRVGPSTAPTAHGTAVALLVHAVAPEADLVLASAAGPDGKMDPDRVAEAILAAADAGADVINLSLSVRVPLADATRADEDSRPFDGPVEDIIFDWRPTLSVPPTPIGEAVSTVAARGVTVVAACGNDPESVAIPAALKEAFAIGFLVVHRSPDANGDLTVTPPEGYRQGIYADFQLPQPAGVLGTSFATPLVSGFCVLMTDTSDMAAYRDVAINCGNADGLVGLGLHGDAEMVSWVTNLYRRGLDAMPHPHLAEVSPAPCSECALFAVGAYCNAGLHALRLGALEGAERLLRTARGLAPRHVDSAANLAMTLAVRADREREDLSRDDLTSLLSEAHNNMAFAHARRPDNLAFAHRAAEFAEASQEPEAWHLGPGA